MNEAISTRLAAIDWRVIEAGLGERGYAVLPRLLEPPACVGIAAGFDEEAPFRRHIQMQRHGYGRGEYKYYAYPLPPLIAALREALYPPLAAIANAWAGLLQETARYPATHAEFLARCHAAGQARPTCLLLRYGEDDYNCLHQDLYGEEVFPLQCAVLLSAPGADFTGGEFVLTEQRPRMQSKVEVVPLAQGDAVIFAVRHRPARGVRGHHRLNLRHGVSRLRSGQRHTLGVIFHDAS